MASLIEVEHEEETYYQQSAEDPGHKPVGIYQKCSPLITSISFITSPRKGFINNGVVIRLFRTDSENSHVFV